MKHSHLFGSIFGDAVLPSPLSSGKTMPLRRGFADVGSFFNVKLRHHVVANFSQLCDGIQPSISSLALSGATTVVTQLVPVRFLAVSVAAAHLIL